MKVTVSPAPKSQVSLRIEVEESELAPHFDRAVEDLSHRVSVPGFRPGKIPRTVLEQHVGLEALRATALDLALPHFYADAVLENKVSVVARPEIKIIQETPFVFEAVVAVLPEVKISGYDKIKVSKQAVDVSDQDVQEVLDAFRKRQAEYLEVDRPAQKGDRVEMDFSGYEPEGDVPLEGTASKNHPVIVGEGSLIPGFEDQLVGMKKGDQKTFELVFPDDYSTERFKGKKVKFSVTLHRVQEVKLPELTPEWIQSISGEEKDLETFKSEIKDNLRAEREKQEEQRRENELFEALAKRAELEIPDALVEEEIDFMLDRKKRDFALRGVDWDQYLDYVKSQKRDLRADHRERAEKQVKLRLILQHLLKEEKMEISEDELAQKIEERVSSYPEKDQDRAKSYYAKDEPGYAQFRNSLLIDRLIQKLLKL